MEGVVPSKTALHPAHYPTNLQGAVRKAHDMLEKAETFSFTSKFDNHIFYDLSPFSLAGMKNECMIDDA